MILPRIDISASKDVRFRQSQEEISDQLAIIESLNSQLEEATEELAFIKGYSLGELIEYEELLAAIHHNETRFCP